MLKRRYRYAMDGGAILVCVAIGLVLLSRERSDVRRPEAAAPSQPSEAWTPSEKHDAEANANFTVEAAGTGNIRLAGKSTKGDWPTFNGPRGDNQSGETGLLPRWPPGGPKLAWTSHGLGAGFSSVSVVRGIVYTMGNKGASEAVIALDAGSGEKIWSTPFAWASHLNPGDGPRSTPTVSGDAVFALSGYGELACLDARSGAIRWQKDIVEEFGARHLDAGMRESVLIDENRLFCTPGGSKATFVALDPQTGELIWQSLLPGKDRASYASPVVAEIGGVRQYVQFTATGAVGIRAKNGEFLWRDNSTSNTTANCSSPLVVDHFVFTSSNYESGGSLLKLSANSATVKAALVYHTREMKSHHGNMVIVRGLLYGSSGEGVLTCLELASGKVKWRSRSAPKGAITYAEDRLYLRSEDGKVYLIEATGAGYRELGRFDEPARSKSSTWSHPVVAAGKLFLGDQDRLLCYDLQRAK